MTYKIFFVYALALLTLGCANNEEKKSSLSTFSYPTDQNNQSQTPQKSYFDQTKTFYEIKSRYSCDTYKNNDVYNFINSYFREGYSTASTMSLAIYLDMEKLRKARQFDLDNQIKLTQKFISPSYANINYIDTNRTIIIDTFIKERNPEVICIKEKSNHEFEAIVITSNNMDHIAIDSILVRNESGRKYIYPVYAPKPLTADHISLYLDAGISNIPNTRIKASEKLFKQYPNMID